jgi:bacteriocin biosynthesis cyclodehydratase domain-containing protein
LLERTIAMHDLTRLPARPRVRASVEVLRASSGDMYLLPVVGSDLVLRAPSRAQHVLLEALDGTCSVRQIAALVADVDPTIGLDSVAAAIGELHELAIVEDAAGDEHPDLTTEDRSRFDPQLRYLADVATSDVSCAEAQVRLKRSTVAVIGLGGLGSWVALSLAMSGVGHLVGYDDDRVEAGNLHRQILYGEADIGLPKADAAAVRLAAQALWTRVDTYRERLHGPDHVAAAIAGADLVVEAADWPAHLISRWVDEACRSVGVPHISASLAPPVGRVGPLIVPGQTACFLCHEAALRRRSPLYDEVAAMRGTTSARAANSAPALGAVATLLATEALHHLSGVSTPATLGAAIMLDLRTLHTEREEREPDPDCDCGAYKPVAPAGGYAAEQALSRGLS